MTGPFPTIAVVLALAILGVPLAAWNARARARRREARAAAESLVRAAMQHAVETIDTATAILCDPCNGKPGKCRCTGKWACTSPLCGAEDTGVMQLNDEWFALLDREGPQ